MIVDLIRIEDGPEGTFGVLRVDRKAFCVTLEPPDKKNQKRISCIPEGVYLCSRYMSPKYGMTFEITDIPNRDFVLFHAGNVVRHTKGCVILAQYFGKLMGDRAVLNSGNTFKRFMKCMGKRKHFIFRVSRIK